MFRNVNKCTRGIYLHIWFQAERNVEKEWAENLTNVKGRSLKIDSDRGN